MKRMNLIIASIILLAFMNAVTLWFLFARETNGSGKAAADTAGPAGYIVEHLKLDPAQQDSFEVLKQEHRRAMDQIRREERDLHEAFFSLLKKNEPGPADSLAGLIAAHRKQGLLVTLDHFQKLKALCRPEQQQRFAGIIDEIVRNFGPPPPGRQGPPPGPRPPGR